MAELSDRFYSIIGGKIVPKTVSSDDVQYHIGLSRNMIQEAEYVVLPGDPYRVEELAKVFDPKAKFLAASRDHISYLADFHGQKVLICSTGLGSPCTGIATEELATIGLKYFLRVGTCGAIQPEIELGDIVVSSGCVRLEGTSKDYAPVEYPAIPSLEFTNSVIKGIKNTSVPLHVGITASTDTFWPAQERYDNYHGYLLRRHRDSIAEWRALNVFNFEMEASALFVMCSTFRLHAACLCAAVAKRVETEKIALDAKAGVAKKNWEKATVAAIHASMSDRGLIKS